MNIISVYILNVCCLLYRTSFKHWEIKKIEDISLSFFGKTKLYHRVSIKNKHKWQFIQVIQSDRMSAFFKVVY
jgi:hypothetical protein